MLNDFIIPVIASFFATLGFALFYNIRGKNIFVGSVCGAVAWAVYLICQNYSPSMVLPYMVAGIAISVYSEVGAYIFKTPVTVYLILGIIPLVPGLTIFRTMQSCLNGDISAFAEGLLTTVKIGGSIVLGIILMSSFFRFFRSGVVKISEKRLAK